MKVSLHEDDWNITGDNSGYLRTLTIEIMEKNVVEMGNHKRGMPYYLLYYSRSMHCGRVAPTIHVYCQIFFTGPRPLGTYTIDRCFLLKLLSIPITYKLKVSSLLGWKVGKLINWIVVNCSTALANFSLCFWINKVHYCLWLQILKFVTSSKRLLAFGMG